MSSSPRIGIPFLEPSGLPDAVHDFGGEPIPLRLQPARPEGGVALAREWVADMVEISCSGTDLDALLLDATRPEELAGMLLAALRLNLPAVCVPPPGRPFAAALAALGLAPVSGDPASIAVALAGGEEPRPRALVDNFSVANGLRAGVAAGGGPELLVHLAAIAREADIAGFSQMIRVLAPETLEADPGWLREHGVPGLLASLGDAIHDVPTVAGNLKESLPPAQHPPGERSRLALVRARASGAEAVCRVREGVTEAAGACRVFGSEEEATRAVRAGGIEAGAMIVVGGCGPAGGPGLLRLDALGAALGEAGPEVPVLTDGLAPEDAQGVWISLFTPEAAAGGVLGLLQDGDAIRIDLAEGRIRTGVGAREFGRRERRRFPSRADTAYAGRYSRSALPALEGAGFG